MKNLTYSYANERAGLITHAQFVWIKHLRHIKYAVVHAQWLRPKVDADDRKFKAMQESFDKTTDMYMAIRYQHKIYAQRMFYFCLEAMIDKVLTRLRQKFFKERRRTTA